MPLWRLNVNNRHPGIFVRGAQVRLAIKSSDNVSNFFQGGGGSNCLFPIETHIICDFPGGGGVRTPCPPPLDPHLIAHHFLQCAPTSILHLDSDQPVRMCSCKRISVFDISFMKMTFTSANFFNYDQTMAITCTYII